MKIQPKHWSDIDNLLRGASDIEAIQQAYSLTKEECWKLMNRISHIKETRVEMMRILADKEAKRSGVLFTYERDINPPDKVYQIDDWSFIQNLSYDYPDIFHDCEDNNAVTDLLEAKGVVGAGTSDPEMCCSYFYFKSKRGAEGFLKRLNAFCNERLAKGRAV